MSELRKMSMEQLQSKLEEVKKEHFNPSKMVDEQEDKKRIHIRLLRYSRSS